MPLSFQTEISPAHVRAATSGIFWRQALQPLVQALAAVLWAGSHLTLYVLFPNTPWFLHFLLALLFVGSAGGSAWLASRHYQDLALRNFGRLVEAPVAVRLEPDAYHYRALWGEGQIAWGQFQSLWRFKDVWVFLQHAQGGVSVLLPTASLDGEAREYLVARMKEAGAKVLA